MKSPSRIKVTPEEHNLVMRYREQAQAFNNGVAACIVKLKELNNGNNAVDIDFACDHLASLRKDHG
jgi:hypothetical protein